MLTETGAGKEWQRNALSRLKPLWATSSSSSGGVLSGLVVETVAKWVWLDDEGRGQDNLSEQSVLSLWICLTALGLRSSQKAVLGIRVVKCVRVCRDDVNVRTSSPWRRLRVAHPHPLGGEDLDLVSVWHH